MTKQRALPAKTARSFCIRFRGDKVRCTDTTDPSGSWRENGYDCIHCDRPGRRTEMYTGSLSQDAHLGLSENVVPLHPMVLLIIIPTKWL